jgi:hypothetical protein
MNSSTIIFKLSELQLDPSSARDLVAISNRRSNTYFGKILNYNVIPVKNTVANSINNKNALAQQSNNRNALAQQSNNRNALAQQSNANNGINNVPNQNLINGKPITPRPVNFRQFNNKLGKPNNIGRFIKKNKQVKNFSLLQFF